jgi:hemerythrin
MRGGAKFPWKPEHALGLPDVDRQHQELSRIVNELHAASGKIKGEAAARRALEKLINYACYHFATEEGIFQEIGLPKAKVREHIQHHEEFVRKVKGFRDALDHGDPIGSGLAAFAAEWLVNHTSKLDLEYAREYLKGRE